MATVSVPGETIFRVPVGNFALSPSAEGYTLNYSVNGVNFDAWDTATAAGKNEIITNAHCGLYYKCVGNQSNLTLQY